MFKLVLLLIIFSILIGCGGRNYYRLYGLVNEPISNSLQDSEQVKIDEAVIGYVERINIQNKKIICVIRISNKFNIPINSKFSIVTEGLLNNRQINVMLSSASVYYQDKDTILINETKMNSESNFNFNQNIADSVSQLFK